MEILERTPYAYRTSFPLDEARVRLPGGSEATVLIKELDRSGLDEATRQAKPEFVADPRREVTVYEEVLSAVGLGTARYFGTVVAPPVNRPALVLEKVDAAELWQAGDLDAWTRAARWVARLHRQASASPRAALLSYDGGYFRRWRERAIRFRPGASLEDLVAPHECAVARLDLLPRVFVHGEFYPSNILVTAGRVCAVDWEMAGLGPGVLDLAALTTAWPGHERARIVEAYADQRGEAVDVADLDAARLCLAIQWLGWSPEWTAPPEHATDWLVEARDAAGRLVG